MTPPAAWVLWLAAVLAFVAFMLPGWIISLVTRHRDRYHTPVEREQVVKAEGHSDNRATYRPAARPRRNG